MLLAPGAIVFSAALALMLAIGAVEAAGLGASGLDVDLDIDLDHGGLLGWLGFGQVPLLVMIVAFLAAFGGLGLAGQQLATMIVGHMLPGLVAIPAAMMGAVPTTALLGRILARIMPHDETTAFDVADLAGRTGTITVGRARAGSPARTRVIDPFGQAHHVLVEPNDADAVFEAGDIVLLVRHEGDRFRAVSHTIPHFSNWID